jgi:hypothetical protein
MGKSTKITVHEAAGRTLEELQALSHNYGAFTFDVMHTEDPNDPRPLVRVLRFPNLTQAMEFAKLFNPGDHDALWFTYPDEVTDVFDQHVRLSVEFQPCERDAIDHGTDDMRDVVRAMNNTLRGQSPLA